MCFSATDDTQVKVNDEPVLINTEVHFNQQFPQDDKPYAQRLPLPETSDDLPGCIPEENQPTPILMADELPGYKLDDIPGRHSWKHPR